MGHPDEILPVSTSWWENVGGKSEAFTFRKARPEDIPKLIDLALVSYGQYKSVLEPEQLEKLRNNLRSTDTWASILDVGKGFLCIHGEEIAGMIFLIPSGNPWNFFRAEWSYIRMAGVHPSYAGRGIAKELTRLCIEEARASGEKIIALHTSEIMPAARHIYEMAGFRILREIEPRLGKRYWLYTLDIL